MHLDFSPKRHRYPRFIISEAVWWYHRFNDSFRDIQEHLAYPPYVQEDRSSIS